MTTTSLARRLDLLPLTATGICSMIGASIYVLPFMIQRQVEGIGPYVVIALLLAAVPAFLAALAYAMLSSAMPRAGGSYIFASRGFHPYLGFIASFSQWFGLSIVIGVVAYVTIPFFRDMAIALEWNGLAAVFNTGWVRVGLALALVWYFVWLNVQGLKSYTQAIIPLMLLMFTLGLIVIITGFSNNQEMYLASIPDFNPSDFSASNSWKTILAAASVLFASFIGFDSIAQAGGEAKSPEKLLPRAIGLAVIIVAVYYIVFTAAVYHTVPWEYVAALAQQGDITVPGLLQPIIPSTLGVIITAGAAIALVNDLPAMLLSVSRLVFAWSGDGIFPAVLANVHPEKKTPYLALYLSGSFASLGILGSHFAGDFFLGIDIMVLAMLVNFLLMCLTVLTITTVNPELADKISIIRKRWLQILLALFGTITIGGFLIIHVIQDINSEVDAWYFKSTPIWLIVMAMASVIFIYKYRQNNARGMNMKDVFSRLPEQ